MAVMPNIAGLVLAFGIALRGSLDTDGFAAAVAQPTITPSHTRTVHVSAPTVERLIAAWEISVANGRVGILVDQACHVLTVSHSAMNHEL